jgi:hypothetical protein
VGQYQTAVNTFTERGFTEAHREMALSLNRDLFDQIVGGRRSKVWHSWRADDAHLPTCL